jgi:hypothetical protein
MKPLIQLKSKTHTEPDAEKMEAFLSGAKAAGETPVSVNDNVKVNVNAPKGCFDETYKRHTVFIHKDIDKEIRQAIKGKGKGEKTAIINAALAEYFSRHNAKH